jgi:hypothetical protein
VVPNTRIYPDKSKANLPNSQGTLADCKAGDPIEVKWVDNARGKPAEWIKVQRAPWREHFRKPSQEKIRRGRPQRRILFEHELDCLLLGSKQVHRKTALLKLI